MVLLIILASVVIILSLGNNGLFSRAKQAKKDYKVAVENEENGKVYMKNWTELKKNGKEYRK